MIFNAFIKLKLLSRTFGVGLLLMLLLCIGTQNLTQKRSLNLVFNKTAELPIGFLIGVSLVAGFLNGGSAAALLAPLERESISNKF